jgi:hypothetical protein
LGIARAGQQLLDEREAHLTLAMSFADGVFRITESEVLLGQVPLQVALAVTTTPAGKEVDLRANGLGLDLERTVAQLPKALRDELARFSMKGEVDLAVKFAGSLEGDGPPLSIGAKGE